MLAQNVSKTLDALHNLSLAGICERKPNEGARVGCSGTLTVRQLACSHMSTLVVAACHSQRATPNNSMKSSSVLRTELLKACQLGLHPQKKACFIPKGRSLAKLSCMSTGLTLHEQKLSRWKTTAQQDSLMYDS